MSSQFQLQKIDVLIGERSDQIRNPILAMLRQQGIRSCRGVHDLKRLKTAILEKPSDLIVVSDDLDTNVFNALRQIRFNRIGMNPFTVLILMVDPTSKRSLQRAMICGADDILAKPVVPKKIVERAKYIAFNRLPFTATKEYIGPYRKQLKLDTRVPLLTVLNTLRDKMEGKKYTLETLRSAVISCMRQVRAVQLDSYAFRLEYTCNLILKAYDSRNVSPEVQGYLSELTDSLHEAADIAGQLNQADLAQICSSFAKQIEEMAIQYLSPTDKSLELVKKLTRAFTAARMKTAAAF